MRISLYGAAGEVTGSTYLIETGRARVLVDFGLHQGDRDSDDRNRRMPPIDAASLDAVIVTHGHIDHIGRLPLLHDAGFKGQIYATPATCKLMPIMLEDSANLQETDARRESMRRARQGRPPVQPLYSAEDVKPILARVQPIELNRPREVAKGVTVRFTESGHILGSASIEMTLVDASGAKRVIAFSGDLGPKKQVLMRDFEAPVSETPADLVICETTYGDRDHRDIEQTVEEFAGVLREALWDKEKVLIPAFAIGRTQTLLYYIGELARSGRVPAFPTYVDSPMGVKATKLYQEFWRTLDAEAQQLHRECGEALCLDRLNFLETGDQSRQLNEQRGAMVIIAGSGMCNGGRIVHHLRHNIYKRGVRVLIAGYQAQGTLGRRLVDGADRVRIFGEEIVVRAKVHTLGGFSAHAGQSDLLAWMNAFKPKDGKPWPKVMLTHGEDGPRRAFAQKLEHMGAKPTLPSWGARVELI
jgi:metallo-beta-lactamase family protein